MAKTREEVAALNPNTKFCVIGRDGIVLHTTGSTVDQRVDKGTTFKVWYLVEHIGDPVPIMVDGDKHKYWLNADVFAELWSKSKIELIEEPVKQDPSERRIIDDREDLKIGMMLEVKDTNTGTWVVGMLLHTYDCEEHSGIIVCLLRPDGSTVDIDTSYADVYTAPDYNINHFCRTLQRYLHETQEKEKLLMHGIRLCKDNENYDKKEESLKAQAFIAKESPLTVYVPPACWAIINANRADFVGYIKNDVNSTPPKLMLACWEHRPFGNIIWYSLPLTTINGNYYVLSCMSYDNKYVSNHPDNMKRVQERLRLIYTDDSMNVPNVRVVTLIQKESPVSITASQTSIAESTTVSDKTEDIVNANVDEAMWFHLGWQPQLSISQYDPMFLVGTRWLKRGDEPDVWVFVANKQGAFKFVTIPMSKPLTYFAFEEACAKAQCKVTDLVNGSDLGYIDGVVGRWSDDLGRLFAAQYGNAITWKEHFFAPIRIIPTKMPILQ